MILGGETAIKKETEVGEEEEEEGKRGGHQHYEKRRTREAL